MIDHYKENIQVYLLILVMTIAGIFTGLAAQLIIPAIIIFLFRKGFYEEIFFGFLIILILSDSLDYRLAFAKNLKNTYIVLLAAFFAADTASFQPLTRLYKTFLPFFLFSVLTIFFSIREPFFLVGLQKTISYILVFFIVPNYFMKLYREGGKRFVRDLLMFCATVLFLGIIIRYWSHELTHIETGRFRGLMGNPNGLGMFCLLFFILFFVLDNLFDNLFKPVERFILYAVILYSVYLTGSRNAVLAIAIFFFFQKFFSLSPVIGFFVFLVILILSEVLTQNFTNIIIALGLGEYFRLNTLSEGSGRYIAWDFAWVQIQKNFFIGKGFGYNEYFMRRNYDYLQRLGHQGGIHNSFLTFWFDQGLVGLLIYLRSYLLILFKAAVHTKYAFPILFSITFSAIFESWLVGSLSVFAFLGLCIFTVITELTKEISIEDNTIIVNEA